MSWVGTCTIRGFFLQPTTASKQSSKTARYAHGSFRQPSATPFAAKGAVLKSGKNDALPPRENSESFEHKRKATPVLTGRGRTLPDVKIMNARSIARYDATYHSNLSTALLHSLRLPFRHAGL